MKAKIIGLIAGAALASIVAANAETNEQAMVTSAPSGNGLTCVIQVETAWPLQNGQLLPACLVCVTNATTNLVMGLTMPATNLFSIELFDSKGNPVQKTPLGRMFGLPLTQKQISDWFNDEHWQRIRHGRAYFIDPLKKIQTRSFSIPQAFEIKEAGEYTLHVRMRLIHNGPDSTGQFPMILLPEVTAKIQIRSGDIPK